MSPLGGGEVVFVEDFFVRRSAADPEFGILYEGERVVCQTAWDEWGPKAENVCVILSSRPTHRLPGEGARSVGCYWEGRDDMYKRRKVGLWRARS
ncbi:MAG: hypothetical protein M3441_24910 [Chloroflexota bacterium]|nr:hypothetical protein [Chloroflexota bacterium]